MSDNEADKTGPDAPTAMQGAVDFSQHQSQITGYRVLSPAEIELINEVKAVGLTVKELLEKVTWANVDARWVSIANTQLQQGFMALTRAIARPGGF